jgi:hypothetical protein
MVSTRSQIRGGVTSTPDNRGRDKSRNQEQPRRRGTSTPAQFCFIPPRYYATQDNEEQEPTEQQQPRSNRNANDDGQNNQHQTAEVDSTHPTTRDIPAVVDANLTRMYKNSFDSLTVDQQQALLRGRVHLPGNPSHNLRASADGPGRVIVTEDGNIIETRALARIIPMRPLDVGKDWALDYTSAQTIKLYNKAIEAIKGEAFDGKYLYSWLARVHDKARAFSWLPILTINGKLLTKNYAEISMEEVRRHAQLYQNEARRGAQNAEQLLTCLQASISRTVYNRVHQLEKKYTVRREPEKEDILDGVCYLKAIIDCYHVNTRSSTAQIRKRLAQLPQYMKLVAKGDVQQLCIHTRNMMDQLQAAGETTMDLLTNFMEALKLPPNADFQRWLKMRIDMWSTKQIDWKQDGSDLMEEAEQYYLELKTTRSWHPKPKGNEIYALECTMSDDSENSDESNKDQLSEKENSMLMALATQMKRMKQKTKNQPKSDKYKWKLVPPKDGEQNTKKIFQDGQKKIYYWCPHHRMWTKHSPQECKKLPVGNRIKDSKATHYKDTRRAYIEAKAALLAMTINSKSEADEDSNDDASHESQDTIYMEDSDSNQS